MSQEEGDEIISAGNRRDAMKPFVNLGKRESIVQEEISNFSDLGMMEWNHKRRSIETIYGHDSCGILVF